MNFKRFAALLLSLAITCAAPVWAAGTTTATVPVTLTVANEYRAVNVTVPASLPVAVINGVVVTADNARISNHSKTGSIRVTGVSVTDGAYTVGNYENFSGSRTIALKINHCTTQGAGKLTLQPMSFPAIPGGDSQAITYFAKVSDDAANASDVRAANVIFTIAITD